MQFNKPIGLLQETAIGFHDLGEAEDESSTRSSEKAEASSPYPIYYHIVSRKLKTLMFIMSLVGCTKRLTKEKTFNFLHKAHASIRKVVQVYKAQTGSVVIMANIVSLCPYSNSGPEDPILFSAATPTLESR